MADIRIKDLATTATTTASGDFMAVDGTTNGTRKLSATAPAFLTSVTTPSLTSPAASPLTLGTGTSGAAVTVLSANNFVGIGTTSPSTLLHLKSTGSLEQIMERAAGTNYAVLSYNTTSGASWGIGVRTSSATPADSFSIYSSTLAANAVTVLNNGGVTIAGTTAGSSGAGALVVAGGLSAAGASYFGGQVTGARPFMSTGAIQANMTSAGGIGFVSGSNATNLYSFGPNSSTSGGFIFQSVSSDASVNFNALTLAAGTGAATFAGAVTINQSGAGLRLIAATAADTYLGVLENTGAAFRAAMGWTQATNVGFLGNGSGSFMTWSGTAVNAGVTFAGTVTIGGNVGFYNASPVAKPTGVAVTAAAIHAALVTLNLIAA